MFTDFLYELRAQGIPVGTHEWLGFLRGLDAGLDRGDLSGLYRLGRAILVHTEGHYDRYDVAFARSFQGLEVPPEVSEALRRWLEEPRPRSGAPLPPEMSDAELYERYLELLRSQTERHDGGNRFIGTGGTSPFGNSGESPQGVQMGGGGGNRMAIYQAEARLFEGYRDDLTLGVRQFEAALKDLRNLRREGRLELDVDETVSRSARNAGDIELAFSRERKNALKILLLMDVGGSMEPHRRLVSRLFTAANTASHFKRFEYRYFHNCPYSRVYREASQRDPQDTQAMMRELPQDFRVVFVGDACMAPWELGSSMDTFGLRGSPYISGLDWIARIAHHFEDVLWLNPEAESTWNHPTIRSIAGVVPMYPLTLAGLRRAVRRLRVGAVATPMAS